MPKRSADGKTYSLASAGGAPSTGIETHCPSASYVQWWNAQRTHPSTSSPMLRSAPRWRQ